MNYTEQQFVRLMEMVEAEGGEHLDEQCKGRRFEISGEPYLKTQRVTLPYCGNSALFEIPYEKPVDGTNAAVLDKVRVCALDDMVGLWPRYEECMK